MTYLRAVLFAACYALVANSTVRADEAFAHLRQPRGDLTTSELAAFERGKQLFIQQLPKLGPTYNDQKCVDCHFVPVVGGSGTPEHAAHVGPAKGNNDIEAYHRYALPGWTVPERPANVSRRIPPPLFGLSLIEQIPDSTIESTCAKGQGHTDSAKLQGSLPRNQVARFGMKPFLGTVPDFVGAALLSEAMVTSSVEGAKDDDAFSDPEVDAQFVADLAAFVRGLPPPGRQGNDAAGEAVFQELRCATCHVPHMPPARDVYSDFCLHRIGEGLADGIFDHEAKGDEFRTTPLWGLRFRKIYLHDGRATTLADAIGAHGGEAEPAATAFKGATSEQRAALLRFLDTL